MMLVLIIVLFAIAFIVAKLYNFIFVDERDMKICIYCRSLTVNLIPFIQVDWHYKSGKGCRVSFGWLTLIVEINMDFVPF